MKIADGFDIAGAIFLLLFFTIAVVEIMFSKGISFGQKIAKAAIYVLFTAAVAAHMLKGLSVLFLIIILGRRYLDVTRRQIEA
jgi:hypothetical protein